MNQEGPGSRGAVSRGQVHLPDSLSRTALNTSCGSRRKKPPLVFDRLRVTMVLAGPRVLRRGWDPGVSAVSPTPPEPLFLLLLSLIFITTELTASKDTEQTQPGDGETPRLTRPEPGRCPGRQLRRRLTRLALATDKLSAGEVSTSESVTERNV